VRKRWILAGYGVLLLASHVVRGARESVSELRSDESSTLLREVRGDELLERRVRVVWNDSEDGEGLPVVLLHGSPGRKGDLRKVGAGLRPRQRTISPDLPGFGASEHDVADYSIRAHARYVVQLLDELRIERFHVVGFSLGGGVAVDMSDLAPERVASIVLLSSIGVQELELFGDYHLNHALHGLQLGGLWAVQELLPHFGWLDDSFLSVAYARNFYDTDQRPLRGHLKRWDGPLLIIHGRTDPLVPVAAALEHGRIVPQSELELTDESHFMAFTRGGELAVTMGEFFDCVERGEATTRAEASSERRAAAALPFDPSAIPPLAGISLVIFLILVAGATLVSEDLTCVAVGAMVAHGRVEFVPGVVACFLGIYVGDLLLFLAGRWVGRRALGRAPLSWVLTEERVERSSKWFTHRGPIVIFLSRFMPGLRLPTYFAAGLLRTSFLRFSFWFALAALAWTPLLVYLSSRLGGALTERVEILQDNFALFLLATVALGVLLVKLVVPMFSHRGRRLIYSLWRRTVRWEYWPPWVFYPPIVVACAWFALRQRSLLAFTAVNPGMPHGGFVGESKFAIFEELAGSAERLALTHLLRADRPAPEALREAEAFRDAHDLDWPLVVKPDMGQRGFGVVIVSSELELARRLEAPHGDLLIQEYIPGEEFGLFYVRRPDEPRGSLISVTTKRLQSVVGDGEHDLERLILDDPRAVCMARFFLAANAARLGEVPAAGERVAIGELGTHCKGAIFLDGAELRTPALERAVDEIAQGYAGFYFGRFDVRAESAAALRRGEFRILELNGVTSEAAHIYDSRHSVFTGWRTIASQWGMAYEIGAVNAARGARVSRIRELAGAFLEDRRRTRLGTRSGR